MLMGNNHCILWVWKTLLNWNRSILVGLFIKIMTAWWCNNHLEKYEFVNGKDDNPYIVVIILEIKNVWNHQPDEYPQYEYVESNLRKPFLTRNKTIMSQPYSP